MALRYCFGRVRVSLKACRANSIIRRGTKAPTLRPNRFLGVSTMADQSIDNVAAQDPSKKTHR